MNGVAANIAKINSKVQTLVVPTDLAKLESVKQLFEKVNKTFGHADVLINNAGLLKANGTIRELDPAVWWDDLVRYCEDMPGNDEYRS